MCRTHNVERYHDYPIATPVSHSEYLYTTEDHSTSSPNIPVVFEPEDEVSAQPTLERHYDVSTVQLGMSLSNTTPARICSLLDGC